MPRKPSQQRAKSTVEAIVEAGMIVLAQEGYQAMTTRRVAEVAGVSVGSLYEYFKDKLDIHDAILAQMAKDAAALIKPMIPRLVKLPLREAVYTLITEVRVLLEDQNGRYLHCVRHSINNTRRLPIKTLLNVLSELGLQYMLRHPELTQARNIPTMGYILIFGGMFTVIYHLHDKNAPISFDELAHGLADMVGFYVQGNLRPKPGK